MVLYLCVLIVFSLHRESLKLILVDEPIPEMLLSQVLPPSPRDSFGDFQHTKPPTFSHSVELMDADDWLKVVELCTNASIE
jgi:hypothetical protein